MESLVVFECCSLTPAYTWTEDAQKQDQLVTYLGGNLRGKVDPTEETESGLLNKDHPGENRENGDGLVMAVANIVDTGLVITRNDLGDKCEAESILGREAMKWREGFWTSTKGKCKAKEARKDARGSLATIQGPANGGEQSVFPSAENDGGYEDKVIEGLMPLVMLNGEQNSGKPKRVTNTILHYTDKTTKASPIAPGKPATSNNWANDNIEDKSPRDGQNFHSQRDQYQTELGATGFKDQSAKPASTYGTNLPRMRNAIGQPIIAQNPSGTVQEDEGWINALASTRAGRRKARRIEGGPEKGSVLSERATPTTDYQQPHLQKSRGSVASLQSPLQYTTPKLGNFTADRSNGRVVKLESRIPQPLKPVSSIGCQLGSHVGQQLTSLTEKGYESLGNTVPGQGKGIICGVAGWKIRVPPPHHEAHASKLIYTKKPRGVPTNATSPTVFRSGNNGGSSSP